MESNFIVAHQKTLIFGDNVPRASSYTQSLVDHPPTTRTRSCISASHISPSPSLPLRLLSTFLISTSLTNSSSLVAHIRSRPLPRRNILLRPRILYQLALHRLLPLLRCHLPSRPPRPSSPFRPSHLPLHCRFARSHRQLGALCRRNRKVGHGR